MFVLGSHLAWSATTEEYFESPARQAEAAGQRLDEFDASRRRILPTTEEKFENEINDPRVIAAVENLVEKMKAAGQRLDRFDSELAHAMGKDPNGTTSKRSITPGPTFPPGLWRG